MLCMTDMMEKNEINFDKSKKKFNFENDDQTYEGNLTWELINGFEGSYLRLDFL